MIADARLDAGRFDIIVQTVIETMMTGYVVLLAARPSNSQRRRSGCRCRQAWQVGPRTDDQWPFKVSDWIYRPLDLGQMSAFLLSFH